MSSGMKGVAQQQQRVSSLQVPDSAYGQCIPYAFGRCRCAQKLIYWGNFQQGTQSGKKGGKSGNQIIYTVNADMLLGYGPFEGIASTWQNQVWMYVNYSSQTFTGSGTGTSFTFTVTNNTSTFVMIMGVALEVVYSQSYSDYGGYGIIRNFTESGTSLLPLYNALFPAPNYGSWANGSGPYAEYNLTYGTDTVTVTFHSPVTNPVVTVYYAENGGADQPLNSANTGKKGGGGVPVQIPGLTFEAELGAGPSGNPQTFTEFSGVGAANMPLGPSPEIPYLNFEVKALFGLGNASPASIFNASTGGYTPAIASGDCNPADIILDIVTSGNRDLNTSAEIWNHGLGFSSRQGTTALEYSYSRYGGILADEFGGGLGLLAIRNYCMAYGIFISGVLDSQRSGADLLDELSKVANCAPVWDGATLDFIPYCEVSAYGNGTSYVAPTSTGPLFNLTELHFQPLNDKAPVELTISRPQRNFNSLQIGFRDATQQFNDNFILVSDSMDIMLQGQMPGSQETYEYITSPLVAQSVGWQRLRRTLTVDRKTLHFSLPAYWEVILTPMDLITVLEPSISANPIPVRITTIEISVDAEGKRKMECTAEPFIYGGSTPLPAAATGAPQSTSGGGTGNQASGNVNTPFFLESIPALNTSGPELWICLSGASQYYGGTAVWLSVDGGSSYGSGPIGVVTGRQTQGVVYSANYPSHADPDSTNTLDVDLTESLGVLTGVSSSAQAAFASLWALAGGGNINVNGHILTIPYELGAYQAASLLTTNKYGLTPPNRRGVFNTPIAAHNIGSQFSFLNDGLVFKMGLTASLIGVTLYFKFTAFNNTGGNQQSLSDVSPYTFTPTGLVGWFYNAGGGGGTGTGGSGTGPYYIAAFEGDPTLTQPVANQILLTHQIPSSAALNNVTLLAAMSGSTGGCKVAPTGSVTITLKQNGTSIGTLNIAASATTMTFSLAAQVVLNPGDILDFVFQGTPDATLAGLWWTIAGVRS